MAFDTGTCRMAFDDNDVVNYNHSSAVSAWVPVYVVGQGVMVPTADIAINTLGAYRKRGILNLIVANGVTVTKGNKVYYDSTNGVVTTTAPTAGFLLGTSIDTGTGTATGTVQVNVDINVFGEEGLINVYGSDGNFKASYATIDLAVAALATNDILKIKAGSYTLGASCVIADAGVKIIGEPGTIINGGVGADNCFSIVLGVQTGTKEVTFENLEINHDDDATQVGIQINNTAMTKKLNVYIKNCEFGTDGGNSIDVDHADATAAIRIYIDNSTTEGPVNMVTANAGDRIRFNYCTVRGGVVTDAGNYDLEMLYNHCIVLHGGISGGHSNQRCIYINCVSETDADPNVYALVDGDDNVGSATDQIIGS